VWNVRKILASAFKLKEQNLKIFITPNYSPEDREKEQKMLKKRRELIDQDVDRKSIKVRGLTLFVNDEECKYE